MGSLCALAWLHGVEEQLREWSLKDVLDVSQKIARSRSRMSFKLKSEPELAKDTGAGRDRKVGLEVAVGNGCSDTPESF